MRKNQKGFTIIELIVVIAIVAILSSIVAVNVGNYLASAKKTATIADFATINKMSAIYAAGNNGLYNGFCKYPDFYI